jgi:glycosyltransferase involved in cell wall biosynthesis
MQHMEPYFSIIIPMYNRERFIARAINSCLTQSFRSFEIIVVDDASTDGSVKVVQAIKDPRIRVIRHETNRERLIARNNGAKASKGEWVIWFDSDDELMPDALAIMKKRIEELPSDVLALRFMCHVDSGHISPDPPHCDEIWDYQGYIRWLESHHGKWMEAIPVVNRQTIRFVLFPEDPVYTSEAQYHLDIASKYRVKACIDVLRLYHLDAENNTWNPNIRGMLKAAPAFAARLESIVSIHGKYLQEWAPTTYRFLFSGLITQLLLSGQRVKAWRVFLKVLRLSGLRLRPAVIIILGTIDRRLLAYVKASRPTRMSFSK